jgi:hypothetical protein
MRLTMIELASRATRNRARESDNAPLRRSYGDTAIDWQAATPGWWAIIIGAIVPIAGAVVMIAALCALFWFSAAKPPLGAERPQAAPGGPPG